MKRVEIWERVIHYLSAVTGGFLGGYTIFNHTDILGNAQTGNIVKFGIALAEAMYCRCVPVVFHLEGSGVNWVSLKGVTGEEIPLGDLQAYANAIDSLLSHPDKMKQYAEASHQRVLDMFTDEKAVLQMNKIYHQL